MANEITETINVTVSNGDYNPGTIVYNKQITQNTLGATEGVWYVGTASELLPFPDITTPGRFFLRNLDSTNFVSFGETTNVGTLKLLAGECAIGRFPSTTVHGKADNAEVKVHFRVLEA